MMLWICAILGAVIALIACIGSTQPQPRKQTKTTIIMNDRIIDDELDDLDDWDSQDQLEELEEEE